MQSVVLSAQTQLDMLSYLFNIEKKELSLLDDSNPKLITDKIKELSAKLYGRSELYIGRATLKLNQGQLEKTKNQACLSNLLIYSVLYDIVGLPTFTVSPDEEQEQTLGQTSGANRVKQRFNIELQLENMLTPEHDTEEAQELKSLQPGTPNIHIRKLEYKCVELGISVEDIPETGSKDRKALIELCKQYILCRDFWNTNTNKTYNEVALEKEWLLAEKVFAKITREFIGEHRGIKAKAQRVIKRNQEKERQENSEKDRQYAQVLKTDMVIEVDKANRRKLLVIDYKVYKEITDNKGKYISNANRFQVNSYLGALKSNEYKESKAILLHIVNSETWREHNNLNNADLTIEDNRPIELKLIYDLGFNYIKRVYEELLLSETSTSEEEISNSEEGTSVSNGGEEQEEISETPSEEEASVSNGEEEPSEISETPSENNTQTEEIITQTPSEEPKAKEISQDTEEISQDTEEISQDTEPINSLAPGESIHGMQIIDINTVDMSKAFRFKLEYKRRDKECARGTLFMTPNGWIAQSCTIASTWYHDNNLAIGAKESVEEQRKYITIQDNKVKETLLFDNLSNLMSFVLYGLKTSANNEIKCYFRKITLNNSVLTLSDLLSNCEVKAITTAEVGEIKGAHFKLKNDSIDAYIKYNDENKVYILYKDSIINEKFIDTIDKSELPKICLIRTIARISGNRITRNLVFKDIDTLNKFTGNSEDSTRAWKLFSNGTINENAALSDYIKYLEDKRAKQSQNSDIQSEENKPAIEEESQEDKLVNNNKESSEIQEDTDDSLLEDLDGTLMCAKGADGKVTAWLIDNNGKYILLEGSKISERESSSIPESASSLRSYLRESGKLNNYKLKENIRVNSLSQAAGVVCGHSVDADIFWKKI